MSYRKRHIDELMHLIFLFFQLYFEAFGCVANSFIMVVLLLALAQVTWLTFAMGNKHGITLTESISLTLCSIPTCLTILNRVWPSRLPLCTLLSCVKPIRAVLSSQFPGVGSAIQCAVAAKKPSVLLACHTSHVKLILPWTVRPWKRIRNK